jgi:hypothetical protein
MNTNDSGIEQFPTPMQRALRGVSTVVATLGLVGLVLVFGSLIFGETRDRLDFWITHVFAALACVLLMYGGYRIGNHAQPARRSSGEAKRAAGPPTLSEPDGIGGTAGLFGRWQRLRNRLKLSSSDWFVLRALIGGLLFAPIAEAIRSGLAVYIVGALVVALLIYLAYRSANDARQALRTAGEAPNTVAKSAPQVESKAGGARATMSSNACGTLELPARFPTERNALNLVFSVLLMLAGFPVLVLGFVGLVSGNIPGLVWVHNKRPFSLTMSELISGDHPGPLAGTIVLMVVGAVLMYIGYCNARRALRASREAPIAATDPGAPAQSPRPSQVAAREPRIPLRDQFFDLFKRRKFGPLSASPAAVFVVIGLGAVLIIKAMSLPKGSLPRELAADNVLEGSVLRTKVMEFYQKLGRLPQPSEAQAFYMAPPDLQRAQSVVWDPVGRMIVITAGEPQPGKRFALHAEERNGELHWTCRSIDFEVKYLPRSCR